MNGVIQIIIDRGLVSINPDGGIDVEILTVLAFVIEYAVVREYPQTFEFDLVTAGVVLHGLSLFVFAVSQCLDDGDGIAGRDDVVHSNTPQFALQKQCG